MSDNLFERLYELFQTPGPVNWRLGAEVMRSITGAAQPVDPHLSEEYQELGRAAALRLAAQFDVTEADIHPIDARGWADANAQSWRFLAEPLADKMGGLPSGGDPMGTILSQMGPAILGMQMGSMVGLMAQRVMGQFDVGLPAMDEDGEFLVVPNVEAFANAHGLDVRQVRMWAALHEVLQHVILHQPWVRAHFRGLLDEYFSVLEFDPGGLTESLATLEDPTQLQELLGDSPGTIALFGGEGQTDHIHRIQAFTSFLEGYRDHVVRKVAGDLLPDLGRIEAFSAQRREEPGQGEQVLSQLIGLELDRSRATAADQFCTEVVRRWGDDAFGRLWESADTLPTYDELTDAVGWAARVLLPDLDDPADEA